MVAEPLLLVMTADGTLSGCSINQRSLVTLWTVPGHLQSTPPCLGCRVCVLSPAVHDVSHTSNPHLWAYLACLGFMKI